MIPTDVQEKIDKRSTTTNPVLMLQQLANYILNERDIICPFCGEGDFDKPGLKDHLKWCGKHLQTIDIYRG